MRVGGALDAYCEDLAKAARVETLCPAAEGWRFGPLGETLAGDEDRRHYLIAGWPGGLTPTHCDFGVQAVLYHTLAGKNRVLGVPRGVAAALHAMREALVATGLGGETDARLLEFEANALHECLARGLLQSGAAAPKSRELLGLSADDPRRRGRGAAATTTRLHGNATSILGRYDEFGPGETMVILPRGGHAVLTGDPHKVVLAGEWHLTPDGVRAVSLPQSVQRRVLGPARGPGRLRDARSAGGIAATPRGATCG